jgi:hypothetical protein
VKLDLDKMLAAADTFLFTAHWVAIDERGPDAAIVDRIQQLRDQLAEARQELEPEGVYA